MNKKIAGHVWDETLRRDVYHASGLPAHVADHEITAVSALCTIEDHIILCHNHRGRDVTGGHIEPGETREETLRREAYEEGGVHIDTYSLHGYIQRTSSEPVARSDGVYYPYPYSYTLRYHCPIPMTVAQRHESPPVTSGDEIDDVMLCSRDDLEVIEMKPCVKDIVRIFMDEHKASL